MGLFDAIRKQWVADDAPTFTAWLLNAPVDMVESLTVELPAEPIRADTVFRVQRQGGTTVVLHIEFQGRTSRPPMSWRMLDYMVRLAQQYRLPIHSVVLYLDQGAGSQDSGRCQHMGADGSADILEVLAACFDPPISEYQKRFEPDHRLQQQEAVEQLAPPLPF